MIREEIERKVTPSTKLRAVPSKSAVGKEGGGYMFGKGGRNR